MSVLITVVLALVFSITQNDAARILAMFPIPSISHQVAFRPLTQELAKRGHQVTVVTPDPAFPKGKVPPNLIEIDVHDLSYNQIKELYKLSSTGNSDLFVLMKKSFIMINVITEMQIKVPEVQKLIKNGKFDLLLLEAIAKPALVLSHVFKVPVIQVSSFGPMSFNVNTVGSSWHPLLYPNSIAQRLYNLTNWEKVVELWKFFRTERIFAEVEEMENVMAKRLLGSDVPSINELKNNIDMIFLNIHPVWEGNRPVPPSVIYMGGIHQNPEKELPKDLKTYLDSSKNGVIYLSFGTNIIPSMLPPEKVQMIIRVFSKLPYDVLWKWDKEELPGRTENIRIFKWLPQSDLLRHPKIKLFITQGGLQSTDEAITAGVPLIGFPMIGDQWYNVEKYVYHKIGVQLDIIAFTEEQLRNAIENVIGDDSYRHNIIRLRELMNDQPQRPLDRAVWWTEYVLRHGGAKHLRSPAANITWFQYLELELVLILLASLLGIFSVLLIVVYYLCIFCSKSKNEKLKKK